jgi:hypothetical protein
MEETVLNVQMVKKIYTIFDLDFVLLQNRVKANILDLASMFIKERVIRLLTKAEYSLATKPGRGLAVQGGSEAEGDLE